MEHTGTLCMVVCKTGTISIVSAWRLQLVCIVFFFEHVLIMLFLEEQSNIKNPPESTLQTYWNANLPSMLSYMEQIYKGFRGYVRDNETGEPLVADIKVEELNDVFFSNANKGQYYRMLLVDPDSPFDNQTFTVTATVNGYVPQTKKVTIFRGQTAPVQLDFSLMVEDRTLMFVIIFACVLALSVALVSLVALGIVLVTWLCNRRKNDYQQTM